LFCLVAIVWSKLSPAAGFLVLVTWLSMPAVDPARKWLVRVGLAFSGLLACGGFVRFVLAEAIPGVIAGGRAAATKHAISFGRTIVTAQDHARSQGIIDPDGDGVGSAVRLSALAGHHPLRSGGSLNPAPLSLRLDQILSSADGELIASGGYLYKLCLPSQAGGFTTNSAGGNVDEEAAERRFLLYGWPRSFTPGGPSQCLFIDQHERILVLEADENGRPRYHGTTATPACEDAMDGSWGVWKNKVQRERLPGDETSSHND
jgi:hypothetical protein